MSAQAFYARPWRKLRWGPRSSDYRGNLKREEWTVELWGTSVLGVKDQHKAVPRPEKPSRSAKSTGRRTGSPMTDGSVGNALRSVYQQTVNEDVPREFLDLLGKLT